MRWVIIFFLIIIMLGCQKYDNYTDCEMKELQKFLFEPSSDDRATVAMSCEAKFPYEKEIYGLDVMWDGSSIKIIKENEFYTVTKIQVTAGKGAYSETTKLDKVITFTVTDGINGFSKDNLIDYSCYDINKTRFWGVMSKKKLDSLRRKQQ